MVELLQAIGRATVGASPVLITGETGTGKELVARALHAGCCADGPFVGINCAALPKDLFEASCSAARRRVHRSRPANDRGVRVGGRRLLFLDEISEIDASLQAKLLRVIEERSPRGWAVDRS